MCWKPEASGLEHDALLLYELSLERKGPPKEVEYYTGTQRFHSPGAESSD